MKRLMGDHGESGLEVGTPVVEPDEWHRQPVQRPRGVGGRPAGGAGEQLCGPVYA